MNATHQPTIDKFSNVKRLIQYPEPDNFVKMFNTQKQSYHQVEINEDTLPSEYMPLIEECVSVGGDLSDFLNNTHLLIEIIDNKWIAKTNQLLATNYIKVQKKESDCLNPELIDELKAYFKTSVMGFLNWLEINYPHFKFSENHVLQRILNTFN